MNKKKLFAPRRNNSSGFTLIELMITLVIIGILGAIAIPSYNKYVLRGKRSEGRAGLMDAAALQERYYSDCNKYGTLSNANNCAASTVKISTNTETGQYTLSIALGTNNQSYTLTATPTFADTECNKLTLTSAGARGITGGTGNSADCWGK